MMELNSRLNSLPDAVRRHILDAVVGAPREGRSPSAPPPSAPASSAAHGAASNGSSEPLKRPAASTVVPDLKLVGACVVDGFIPPDLVKDARGAAQEALAERQRPAAVGGGLQVPGEGRAVDPQSRGDHMLWLHPQSGDAQAGPGAAAARPALRAVTERLEALRRQLLRQGHDVGGSTTYQLALYPGGGARYVRHADASLSCPTRAVTAIVYLNEPDWDPQVDGGCLALYSVPHTTCAPPPAAAPAAAVAAPSDGAASGVALGAAAGAAAAGTAAGAGAAAADELPDRGRAGGQAGSGLAGGEPAVVVAPLGGRLLLFESHLWHEVLPAHRHRYAITAWFHRAPPPPPPAAAAATTVPHPPQSEPQGARAEAAPAAPPSAAPAAPMPIPAPTAAADAHADAQEGASAGAGPGPSSLASAAEMEAGASGGGGGGGGNDIGGGLRGRGRRLPHIFVSIAAYRDPECAWTLQSLFSAAAHPERVRVGVVWQVHPTEDAGMVRVAGAKSHPEWLHRVRQVVVPAAEATGPCKARALAQALWDGEEYVLQLDSHMRMVPGWDELCIQQLAAAEAAAERGKAVLSTYPLGYSGEGAAAACPDAASAPATLLCARGFEPDGFLRTVGRELRERPAAPVRCGFWAAGLSFARSAWLQEVPYCPALPHLFFGEEAYVAARGWTRGWDLFAPSRPLAFHHGGGNGSGGGGDAGAGDRKGPGAAAASARQAEIEENGEQEEGWPVGHVWGLGRERSLADLAVAFGVDYVRGEVVAPELARWGGLGPEAFVGGGGGDQLSFPRLRSRAPARLQPKTATPPAPPAAAAAAAAAAVARHSVARADDAAAGASAPPLAGLAQQPARLGAVFHPLEDARCNRELLVLLLGDTLCSLATTIQTTFLFVYLHTELGLGIAGIAAAQGSVQFLCGLAKGASGVMGDMLGSQARVIMFGTFLTFLCKPMLLLVGPVHAKFGVAACAWWFFAARLCDQLSKNVREPCIYARVKQLAQESVEASARRPAAAGGGGGEQQQSPDAVQQQQQRDDKKALQAAFALREAVGTAAIAAGTGVAGAVLAATRGSYSLTLAASAVPPALALAWYARYLRNDTPTPPLPVEVAARKGGATTAAGKTKAAAEAAGATGAAGAKAKLAKAPQWWWERPVAFFRAFDPAYWELKIVSAVLYFARFDASLLSLRAVEVVPKEWLPAMIATNMLTQIALTPLFGKIAGGGPKPKPKSQQHSGTKSSAPAEPQPPLSAQQQQSAAGVAHGRDGGHLVLLLVGIAAMAAANACFALPGLANTWGMFAGAALIGLHMAMTHANLKATSAGLMLRGEVPGLGRVDGRAASFDASVMGLALLGSNGLAGALADATRDAGLGNVGCFYGGAVASMTSGLLLLAFLTCGRLGQRRGGAAADTTAASGAGGVVQQLAAAAAKAA
ncbi:hypothetical protein HXX76_013512 [Chlamydomonas incerta]|uniref:Prolyl 4-hydroxylase alpha subunit domain-containing protein n=1 Tax=Chlamydomonas incerta TaxID=51695 RepID=A0A835SRX2_CHLIN|nr:hypothetical protein HXX76_013512 [Chlamydomonas incerta]|eukprot:KAG2425670.1 hypothetical protein HXX76_013512 [Chlamydomonas incerta]